MSSFTAADCVYTACFCEENAYKLCEQLIDQPFDLHVAFISNRNRQVGSSPACLCLYATLRLILFSTADTFVAPACLQAPFWFRGVGLPRAGVAAYRK